MAKTFTNFRENFDKIIKRLPIIQESKKLNKSITLTDLVPELLDIRKNLIYGKQKSKYYKS